MWRGMCFLTSDQPLSFPDLLMQKSFMALSMLRRCVCVLMYEDYPFMRVQWGDRENRNIEDFKAASDVPWATSPVALTSNARKLPSEIVDSTSNKIYSSWERQLPWNHTSWCNCVWVWPVWMCTLGMHVHVLFQKLLWFITTMNGRYSGKRH